MVLQTCFAQLYEQDTSTYTYIIADPYTREAAIIDPVLEMVERDLTLLHELNVKLKYILDTHIHADHITGSGELRKKTGAKSCVSEHAGADCIDIPLQDGQCLMLGAHKLDVMYTPGHTNSCVTFYFDGRLFTGDCLLIRGCGRTDFQQGSAEELFNSVRTKLFCFPDDTLVYPGHDYKGHTASTVGLEKKFNLRLSLNTDKEKFLKVMADLKLDNPKRIHEAVPANMACGKIASDTP